MFSVDATVWRQNEKERKEIWKFADKEEKGDSLVAKRGGSDSVYGHAHQGLVNYFLRGLFKG